VISGILADEVLYVWHEVEPVLRKAVERFDTGLTTDDVLAEVQSRDAQLWALNHGDGYLITRISQRTKYSVLEVPYVAGKNMGDWLDDALNTLTEFAQANGCAYIEGYGRRGWMKKTPLKEHYITMRMAV
jgi:hypothetical protein